MKKPSPVFSAVAAALALCLALPPQALALRVSEPREDSRRLSGLEESLKQLERIPKNASVERAVSGDEEEDDEIWSLPPPKSPADFELNEGFLPDDHPAVQFVTGRLTALLPELKPEELPTIRLLASRGQGINAMIFEDGTIVVSPELVESVEYEEELDFVFLHEINHGHRKHIQQKDRLLEASSPLTAVVRALGLIRYQEYESDLAAFWGLLDRHRSGLAAVAFMERLERDRLEKDHVHVDWALAHGTFQDRILNLKSLIPLVHMQYLDAPLHPMEASVRKSLKDLPVGGLFERVMKVPGRDPRVQEGHLDKIEREIRGLAPQRRLRFLGYAIGLMDWRLADSVLRIELNTRYGENTEEVEGAEGEIQTRRLGKLAAQKEYDRRGMRRLPGLWNDALSEARSGDSPEVGIFLRQLLHQLYLAEGLYDMEKDEALSEQGPFGDDDEYQEIIGVVEEERRRYSALVALPQAENPSRVLTDSVLRGELIDRLGDLSGDGSAGSGLSFLEDRIASVMAQQGRRDFLAEAGELLAAFRDVFSRSEAMDRERWTREINQTWTRIVMRQAASELIKTAGLEEDLHQRVAVAARRHGFQEDTVEMDKEVQAHPKLKPWVAKHFPGWTEQQKLFRRLEKVADDISKIKQRNRRPSEGLFRGALLKLADLLNRLPETIAVTGKLQTTMTRSEFKMVYWKDLLGQNPGFVYSDGVIHWGKKRRLELSDAMSIDDLRFLLGWWASVAETGREYQAGVELFSKKNEWMNRWKTEARMQELNALADEVVRPDAAAESIGRTAHGGLAGSNLLATGVREPFDGLAQSVLQRETAQAGTTEGFFELLDGYAQRWPARPNAEVIGRGVFFLRAAEDAAGSRDWRNRLVLGFFAVDPLVRRQMGEYSVLQIVQSEAVSFEEAYVLLFERYKPQGTAGGLRALRALVDRAHTYPELDRLQEAGSNFSKFLQSSLLAGGAVLAEGGVEHWLDSGDRARSFRALLASGQNDWLLRRQVALYWRKIYRSAINDQLTRDFDLNLRYWDDPDEIEDWSGGKPSLFAERISPFEQALDRLYMLGAPERYAVLRKLLADEDGLLRKARWELLGAFLTQQMDSRGEERAAAVFSEVLGTVLEQMPEDDLFLLVSPLLIDRIANAPESPSERAEESVKAGDWSRTIATRLGRSERLKNRRLRAFVETLAPALERKFSWFLRGHGPDVTPSPGPEQALFSVVPQEFYQNRLNPMSPLELTLETARQLGAPGVRFLQLVGQTVRLPEGYRKKFLTVYDNVEGQSLLSVGETIRNLLPEYAGRIRRFVRRLGGGSIYTVWEVEVVATEEEYPGRGGELVREAVRVVNPNALYRARKSVQVIRDALGQLAREQPGSGYALALPMVDLLEEWIAKELEDNAFEADDQEFRTHWDGWAPEGFHRKIVIPRTLPTGIPEIRRAEFLPGQSFTSLSSLEAGEQKELVALAGRFYVQQVMDSVMKVLSGRETQALVLSDISVGNFLRTAGDPGLKIQEGQLGILDRGMFLKFNRAEAEALVNFSGASTAQQRAEALITHLWTLESNRESTRDLAQRGTSPSTLAQEVAAGIDPSAPLEKTALDVVLGIQSRGLRVPLKFQLLFKNFNALSEMADVEMSPEARFGSLETALQYVPAGLEEAKEQAEQPGIIAAGLEDVRGLPLGVALSRMKDGAGRFLPVVYIARSEEQAGGLEELGVERASIFVLGPDLSLEAALTAAADWLRLTTGVRRVVRLGVDQKIPGILEWLVQRLPGISLSPQTAAGLEEWVEGATELLGSA